MPSLQRPDPVGVTMWNLPNLEEEFQDYVWDLLRMEKDFIIGKNNEGRNLTLKDIVDDLRKDKIPKKSGGESDLGDSTSKDQERCEIGQEKWRVYASEERRWRALTGHGVDPKKVPSPDNDERIHELIKLLGSKCDFQMPRGHRQTS